MALQRPLDGQQEITRSNLWGLDAQARRAVISPAEIPIAVHCENFRRLTARSGAALVHQDALTVDVGAREDQVDQRSECAKGDQRQSARPIPHVGETSRRLVGYGGPSVSPDSLVEA